MMLHILRFLAVVVFIAGSALANAGEVETRSFRIPDHGSLQLKVPASWQSVISQPQGGLPPTIGFTGAAGPSFRVMLTPLWNAQDGSAISEPAKLRAQIAEIVTAVRAQAVETEIPIMKIAGRSTLGYYFSATDKAPKPGEYKYLTQGVVRLGALDITFTSLTNDGGETVAGDTLKMLADAELAED